MEINYNLEKQKFLEYCRINEMRSNSHFNYNRFVESIIKNDNQSIESTKTYELLVSMLSDDKLKFKEILNTDNILYRARIIDINNINKFSVVDGVLFGLNKYESKQSNGREK